MWVKREEYNELRRRLELAEAEIAQDKTTIQLLLSHLKLHQYTEPAVPEKRVLLTEREWKKKPLALGIDINTSLLGLADLFKVRSPYKPYKP